MVNVSSNGRLPVYRTINGISILISYLASRNIPVHSILDGSGITVADLQNPDKYIRTDQELIIYRKIQKLKIEPEIGLIIGEQAHVGIHGNLGVAAMLSDTIMAAATIALRYTELTLTYFHYELTVKDNLAFLKMKELVDLGDLTQFVCELEFVSVYRMCRDVIGRQFPLHEVHIAYSKPDYGSQYDKYFNCAVTFNAPDHMFVFDAQLLNTPLPKANPLMKKVYEEECRKLSIRLKECETFSDKIYNELYFYKDGQLTMEEIAHQLNMTTRTLRRKLTAEGTTYKAIVSDFLLKKAISLLTTTVLPIEKIAEKLGYSDTPNFYHAFKIWTGTSPGKYRLGYRKPDNE